MAAVNIDVGIGECIRTVDSIAERRKAGKRSFYDDLSANLEAVAEIVRTLDNLFIALVRGFSDPRITSDPQALSAHVSEAMRYLTHRELLPRLETMIGEIKETSVHRKIANHEELAEVLAALVDSLERYRGQLGRGGITGVGQEAEWNLMTLCEKAHERPDGGKDSLGGMALQVHRNHDFRLSDAIHSTVGRARGLVKGLMAFGRFG